jgi:ketosteroid isomerase-like protein
MTYNKKREAVMLRSFMPVTVLAIALALPAMAQQTSEQEDEAHNKAGQAKDAAAVGALYTVDAVVVTPNGQVVGRDAIQQTYAEHWKVFTPDPAKTVRTIMIGDAVKLRTGTWSGVFQSPKGPVPLKGNWSTSEIRDGDTWKIRMETDGVATPSAVFGAEK